MAALSTMFRIVKRLIALSLGQHREQFEQRMNFTCPLLLLFRPFAVRFFGMVVVIGLWIFERQSHYP